MKSLFYITANSLDEDINHDTELISIREEICNDQKENCLFNDISEEEFLKIFSNNSSTIDNPEFQINSVSNKYTSPFLILNKKKRGRQTEKFRKSKHLSTDFDNLQRKIQVHFFTFIINLSNDALKAVLGPKTPYNFKQIDYKIKISISHENVNFLHKLAIKDLLKMKISPKNKKYSYYINNDTLNEVCHRSKLLEKFFDIKYLKFFNDFYFNEEKEANKIIFEGKEIPFSKETKNFYHLLKKYENYKTLLIDSAKSIYFYGYNGPIRNNSFVTYKKDNELSE